MLRKSIKNQDDCYIPIKLNLTEFVSFKDEEIIYYLNGIILHHGLNINQGHYSGK